MTAERPLADLDLTACDREPIHLPGAVQPHGVPFAFDEAALTVLQASDSVERHLGMPASRIVGRPLAEVLPGAAAVRDALAGNGSHLDPLRLEAAGTAFERSSTATPASSSSSSSRCARSPKSTSSTAHCAAR